MPTIEVQPQYTVLDPSTRNDTGNRLLLFGEGHDAKVLKLYRERYTAIGSFCSSGSHRLLERKRGISPKARYRTEVATLAKWKEHGFDVFQHLDMPLPEQFDPPGIWLEYCPGKTMGEIFKDPEIEEVEKVELVTRLARDSGWRHKVAFQLNEPLLVQEHATIRHVMVYGDRLIRFDFENGFLPKFHIVEALAQELASCLKSIVRCSGEASDPLFAAFASAYPEPALLREVLDWGVCHRGLYRRVRRWYDQKRRPGQSKTDSLARLRSMIVEA